MHDEVIAHHLVDDVVNALAITILGDRILEQRVQFRNGFLMLSVDERIEGLLLRGSAIRLLPIDRVQQLGLMKAKSPDDAVLSLIPNHCRLNGVQHGFVDGGYSSGIGPLRMKSVLHVVQSFEHRHHLGVAISRPLRQVHTLEELAHPVGPVVLIRSTQILQRNPNIPIGLFSCRRCRGCEKFDQTHGWVLLIDIYPNPLVVWFVMECHP